MCAKVYHVISFFQQNPVYIFLPPYLLLHHPIFHSLIKNTNYILLGVRIMKFLSVNYLNPSVTSSPLGANIVLNTLFSKVINLWLVLIRETKFHSRMK